MADRALISDFDGTITDVEFYELILAAYAGPGIPDYFAEYAQGKITHFEAMRAIFSLAPADERALDRLVAGMRPDPHFGPAAECLRGHGWELIIVSAGSSWYIERLLRSVAVEAVVYANPGHIEPGRGLVLELPSGSPFFSAHAGIDKEAVVRNALTKYSRVAFAGNGAPDLRAALVAKPDWRFARGWLARELNRRGQPFREFRRWSDMARMLAEIP